MARSRRKHPNEIRKKTFGNPNDYIKKTSVLIHLPTLLEKMMTLTILLLFKLFIKQQNGTHVKN